MKISKTNLKRAIFVSLLPTFFISAVVAEETIIQQEEISFEKCLEVIKISANKLSISPEIQDVLEKKRIAIFSLVDGTLTISCDGAYGTITVSTNTN